MNFIYILMCLVFVSMPAAAQTQDSTTANWPNLVRSMVRFNALNMSDPNLIDEYAIITECDMYKAFYHDDFKWNQVRQAVRESVKMNIATFPVAYHYDIKIDLDRYDFDAKIYRFTERSALRNVNTFMLYSVNGTGCGAVDVKFLPRVYRAVISAPIYMDGLPLGPAEAQAMLKQMDADGNVNHTVYAKFNLRIVYVEPLQKVTQQAGGELITHYRQSNVANGDSVRFDVRMDSVDVYSDPAMARLVYEYKP